MARAYSRRPTSVWRDTEFKALSMSAQWTYDMLTSQPDISSAGSLPLTTRRWAQYAADMTVERLDGALIELERAHFIVVDRDTEEVLVRSFVKWDGGATSIKRLPSIVSAASAISSPGLRGVLAHELDRLDVAHGLSDEPLDVKDALSDERLDTEDALSDALSDGVPDRASDTPRVVVTKAVPENNPQPTTRNTSQIASDPRPDVDELCELLADRIADNGSKRPTITKGWRDAARLMLDRDERSPTEAKRLIRWSQDHSFWRSNIHSMPKFREQYDKLRLQAGTDPPAERAESRWQYGVFG